MAVRLAALLPRAVVVALVWVLATAAFTFAADTTIIGPSSATSTSTPAKAPELVVPSVTGQAYVFAKGILEDGGFAWHVTGGVRGYASNRVMAQSPAAGTRVVDTGAPMIVLRLVRGAYAEKGIPVDASSYLGTKIKLANLAAATVPVAPVTKPAVKSAAKPVLKPHAKPKLKKLKPVVQNTRPAAFSFPARRRSRLTRSRSRPAPVTSRPGSPSARRRARTSRTGSTSTPGSSPAPSSAGGTEPRRSRP